ncbi:isopenicillin N synthase family dioxygenase [Rhizorhapis sp.]|uniref:isopenicillin N synthase family dioxygenase n=1 Tax=Rhizorhapis sp. TaxID=1968842 RepID=UPI002B492736|nr:2-oxoglutarate and iron-dependent oxygenase domain-containing protein [Rhizorhapis sp.]HKR18213.1 2-oxoglutarate and iron-dependent oxygenase domain-containing protein [Rhizorhapis sp.]
MPSTILEQVPVLSMSGGSSPAFAQALGSSFERFGFAMVQDHGLDSGLVEQGWALAKAFFALPEAVKRQYHIQGGAGQRGYTPYRTEIAKDAAENDLKEFWHVGRDLPEDHPFADRMPANVWPAEIAPFKPCFQRLFAEFDRVGGMLLSAIALHLGLPGDWFDDAVRDGNSILRLLHYPPVPADAPGIRAGAHEDINLITLLLGAEEAGLELLDREGRWLPVNPPEGALVVNVGDMLQRLTNHRLPSTTHRVCNPPPERRGHSRYSMPFFLHLRPDFLIGTLPDCVDEAHPNRYPEPIMADAYLMERLREIGLLQ